MSESETLLFKDYFNEALATNMASRIQAIYPAFAAQAFVDEVAPQLDGLEMKARTAVFADALHKHLPADFAQAWAILAQTLGPGLGSSEGALAEGWHYWPVALFIEKYGLESFDDAMPALLAITKRHTAEFAIRPYLLRYPEQTLALLHQWALDDNEHVRRLVSEGTRPRLPWGARLKPFMQDPSLTLALLEKLKDDPSAYVRRSVANHLNDIGKDNPAILLQTAVRWQEGATPERRWIIGHALRSLVKAGHPTALQLLGYGPAAVRLHNLQLQPTPLPFGQTLFISFSLENESETAQAVIVDYVVHFVKARGGRSAKVFKLRTFTLDGREQRTLQKRHAFVPITTRRYYPGMHRVEIQVNGEIVGSAEFELQMTSE